MEVRSSQNCNKSVFSASVLLLWACCVFFMGTTQLFFRCIANCF